MNKIVEKIGYWLHQVFAAENSNSFYKSLLENRKVFLLLSEPFAIVIEIFHLFLSISVFE